MSHVALPHSGFQAMKTTQSEVQTSPGGINVHKNGQTFFVIISMFAGTSKIAILLIFLKLYLTKIRSKDIMTRCRDIHHGVKWTEFPHDTLDARSSVLILPMGRPPTSRAGPTGVREDPPGLLHSESGLSSLRQPPVSWPSGPPQSPRGS